MNKFDKEWWLRFRYFHENIVSLLYWLYKLLFCLISKEIFKIRYILYLNLYVNFQLGYLVKTLV